MGAMSGKLESLKILFLFCCVLLCCRDSLSNPTGDQGAMQYLQKYGYLDRPADGSASIATSETVIKAVKDFQEFAGLEQTGTLNDATIEMMNKPRCGMKDVQKEHIRRKRFAPQGSKWKINRLTYRISKYPSRIERKEDVHEIIGKAFKVWSDVSDLSFVERDTGRVNVDIRFEKKNHGKCERFDGPGYVLAHAFYPIYGGQVHFDDEEDWTLGGANGINLLQVAVHEIGHSLGLDHSHERKATMAPFYNFKPTFSLNQDDIAGIQMIYGAGSHKDICRDSSIQSATMLQNGEIYVFKGEFYWRVLLNGIAGGYPRTITDDWYGLPGNLDAAFTGSSGKTFFFKGDQYWRFNNRRLEAGYPRPIREGFPKIPDNLDAAVLWNGNNKVYFFKGSLYWQFDQDVEDSVKDFYPLRISEYWHGLPDNMEASFLAHDNRTYFFKDDKYYRFYDDKVEDADPPYPRSTSKYWFGCPSIDQHPTVGQFEAVNIINP